MKIEVERFPDKRLKMVDKYYKNDTNIRINPNEISICPKITEIELQRDVLEAINLWNLMFLYPKLRDEINQVLKRHGKETLEFSS